MRYRAASLSDFAQGFVRHWPPESWEWANEDERRLGIPRGSRPIVRLVWERSGG